MVMTVDRRQVVDLVRGAQFKRITGGVEEAVDSKPPNEAVLEERR